MTAIRNSIYPLVHHMERQAPVLSPFLGETEAAQKRTAELAERFFVSIPLAYTMRKTPFLFAAMALQGLLCIAVGDINNEEGLKWYGRKVFSITLDALQLNMASILLPGSLSPINLNLRGKLALSLLSSAAIVNFLMNEGIDPGEPPEGAFWDNHDPGANLQRRNAGVREVDLGLQALRANRQNRRRENAQTLEFTAPPIKPTGSFSDKEILFLRNYIASDEERGLDGSPFVFQMDRHDYTVSFHQGEGALRIHKSGEEIPFVEFILNASGEVIMKSEYGESRENLMGDHLKAVEFAINTAYRGVFRQYGHGFQVVTSGVGRISDFILEALVHQFKQQGYSPYEISVTGINDALKVEAGADAGGLTRQLIDDIFSAVAEKKISKISLTPSSKESENGLVVPQAKWFTSTSNSQSLDLDEEERKVYENLGYLMNWVIGKNINIREQGSGNGRYTREVATGVYLSEDVFKGMQLFTEAQLNRPYTALSKAEHMQLIRDYAYTQGAEAQAQVKLITTDLDNLSDDEVTRAFQGTNAFMDACGEPDGNSWEASCFLEGDPSKINPAKVRENWDHIKAEIASEDLKAFHAKLAPLHAMAVGLKQGPGIDWDQVRAFNSKGLKDLIQGKTSRSYVKNKIRIEYGPSRISGDTTSFNQKVEWLKRWVMDDRSCSEAELKQFLKFVGGASSLPGNKEIKVNCKTSGEVLPNAHTCSWELEINGAYCGNDALNDRTYGGFVKALKVAISETAGTEQY